MSASQDGQRKKKAAETKMADEAAAASAAAEAAQTRTLISLVHALSEYEIGSPLGSGAFGIVIQARPREPPGAKDIAIKAVPLNLLQDSKEGVEVLKERLGHVERINHPGIIRTFGHRVTQKDLLILMELCVPDHDLFSRIEEAPDGRIPELEAKKVLRNLCGAVAYLHDHLILHGDIKADNCFYRERSDLTEAVVLSDFTCARIATRPDQIWNDGTTGTFGYMSPEMLAGKGYGLVSDMFSLGVTAYTILGGSAPFASDDDDALREETIRCEIDFPDEIWGAVSAEGQTFVKRMLEKDPQKRMTATQALLDPWLKVPSSGGLWNYFSGK